GLVEVHDELCCIWCYCQSPRLHSIELTPFTTSGIWAKAACWAMCCCIASKVDSSIWGWGMGARDLGLTLKSSRIEHEPTILVVIVLAIVSDGEREVNVFINVGLCCPKRHPLLRH